MSRWEELPTGTKGTTPLIHQPFSQWWFHGYIHEKPQEGAFMSLPAGGTFVGELACDKQWTTYGGHEEEPFRACTYWNPETSPSGVLHSGDPFDTPLGNCKDLKGTALAIAYESDPHKVKPSDLTVISTNQRSPWMRRTEYQIPAGLRPCPPGGCTCMWGWIHGTKGGKSDEMYLLGYRCNVTNGDPNGRPLPAPQPAVKCMGNKDNCTRGAKQLHFWQQAEGNNNQQPFDDPPYYNTDYGFADGAQNDIWDTLGPRSLTTELNADAAAQEVEAEAQQPCEEGVWSRLQKRCSRDVN